MLKLVGGDENWSWISGFMPAALCDEELIPMASKARHKMIFQSNW